MCPTPCITYTWHQIMRDVTGHVIGRNAAVLSEPFDFCSPQSHRRRVSRTCGTCGTPRGWTAPSWRSGAASCDSRSPPSHRRSATAARRRGSDEARGAACCAPAAAAAAGPAGPAGRRVAGQRHPGALALLHVAHAHHHRTDEAQPRRGGGAARRGALQIGRAHD